MRKELKDGFSMIGWIVVLACTVILFLVGANFVFTSIEDRAVKEMKEEESSLLESFSYVENGSYFVTDKYEGNITTPSLVVIPVSYLIAVKDDVVYRLQIPATMYNRLAVGMEMEIQEGKEDRYGLTVDGKNVIKKVLVEEDV